MKITKRDVILFLLIDLACCAAIVVLVLNKG